MSNINTVGYQQAGQMFTCANVSTKILTVVGTAMTGLILYNPIGSGKRAIFMTAGFSWTTVSPSAQSIGLGIMGYSSTAPSSLTVGGAIIKAADGGPGVSAMQTWDVATLPAAPVAARWFAGAQWITGGTGQFPYALTDKIDGELGLYPGAAAAFIMIGGTGPTGLASLSYIETPVNG